jgi:organic hydroperoxide reductase OsmC/OhrA
MPCITYLLIGFMLPLWMTWKMPNFGSSKTVKFALPLQFLQRRYFCASMNFEGTATWKSGVECDLVIKGKKIATVSPPPSFGGKEGMCSPEDIFAAALATCMNTLFLLIARNSNLALKKLDTKAKLTMNVEGMEKLIFTDVHFTMSVGLQMDNERDRKKARTVYDMAQKICRIRQSWGEGVPISFDLVFT